MNRSTNTTLAALLAGSMLAFLCLAFVSRQQRTAFEDFALDDATIKVFPDYDGYPIHICKAADEEQWRHGWENRGKRPVALWLGNSQLHAINQGDADSLPASDHFFHRFDQQDLDALTWSLPNANLQEHYLLFEHVCATLPLKAVILPVVFDDLRESDVRDDLQSFLANAALAQTETGRRLVDQNMQAGDETSFSSNTNASLSLQETTETYLENWMEQNCDIYAARDEFRGQIFANAYTLRNRVFHITSQSVRRVVPGRYALNQQALLDILKQAQRRSIEVFVYVAPLRQDIKTPYDAIQYATFKNDVCQSVAAHGGRFTDLDRLVPGDLWGTIADFQGRGQGYDFMHFQAGGHDLLAKAIGDEVQVWVRSRGTAASNRNHQRL